jgi:release factor glutamine methyltransferase
MSDAPDIGELLRMLTARLAAVSDSPRLDAEMLLALAIDTSRSYLFAHPEDVPDDAAIERLERTVARRLAGEPMAYLTGTREFWSMELMVTPDTLVPRPETEALVELALAEIPRRAAWAVLDLGTGSGAIALAVARERRQCEVVATDVSAAALAVARENARHLELPNVEFLEGRWGRPVHGRCFRVVMANPPYVASGDPALAALAFEPRGALDGGPDGLDAIRVIAGEAGTLLAAGGLLLVEHGAGQENAVAAICREHGYEEIHCTRDVAGLPRVTSARRAGAHKARDTGTATS